MLILVEEEVGGWLYHKECSLGNVSECRSNKLTFEKAIPMNTTLPALSDILMIAAIPL